MSSTLTGMQNIQVGAFIKITITTLKFQMQVIPQFKKHEEGLGDVQCMEHLFKGEGQSSGPQTSCQSWEGAETTYNHSIWEAQDLKEEHCK